MNTEIVYFFAFDIAQEADLARTEAIMRGSTEQHKHGRLKDSPRNFPMHRPLSIRLNDITGDGPRGPITLHVSVKLFAVGAMSVKVRLAAECEHIMDLLAYRDLRFADGTTLEQRILEVARRVFQDVTPGLDTPVPELLPEGYTVFCIRTPLAQTPAVGESDCEQWLQQHEREIAALLVGEPDPARLSRQEVQDTTRENYSYYQNDLAVLDWDAALLVDTPEDYNDTLYVIEMANLQLEELHTYDSKLDEVLDKAYDDVERAAKPYEFGERQRVLKELRALRMDLTKVSDEISNITKFFGDWHLARIYMGCAKRFHVDEWENMVTQKLRALDSLYTILQQDSTNRAMLLLEVAVVALFVIDLVVIVILGIK